MVARQQRFEFLGGSLHIRERAAWHMLKHLSYWQHDPTTIVFEISVNPELFADAPLRAECLKAKLVHIGPEHAVPPDDELKRLAQEAVLMCLHELKVVSFVSDHWVVKSGEPI